MNEFEMRLALQQLLEPLRILDARHLQQNLMRILTSMTCQRRLGHTDRVDASVDDLHRLIRRRFRQRALRRSSQCPRQRVT